MSSLIIPKENILQKVNLFRNSAIARKKILLGFLETNNINQFIIEKILNLESIEKNKNNNFYTYWCDGGLSWFYWFDKSKDYTEEDKLSMTFSNLKFNYLCNDIHMWQNKTKELYSIVQEIQEFILTNLEISTRIEITNFDYNKNTIPEFDFSYNSSGKLKEPNFNIKLIIDIGNEMEGGARKPKKNKKTRVYDFLKLKQELKVLKTEDSYIKKFFEDQHFSIEQLPIIDKKIIVEFNLEYIQPNFNLESFKNKYLIISTSTELNRKNLNRLNDIGLLTFSYLNTTKTEIESGLNVEKVRQLYMMRYLKSKHINISDYLQSLITTYRELYQNQKSFNIFFIEKIEEIANSIKSPYFSNFIDFIDKYLFKKPL